MSEFSMPASTRLTLLSLSSINSQIDKLQTRLSTGKRVSSALDDPGAFFTAAGLNSRANAINGLMSDITNVKSAVSAANQGITAIRSLLSAAQTVANQALQYVPTLVTVTGTNSSAFTTGSPIATIGGSATSLQSGDTVTVSDGTTTATYTAANGDTIQSLLNAVNNTAGLKVAASLNSSGQLAFAATSNVNVTIGGTLSGAGGGTLTGILGLSAGTTNFTPNAIRQGLAAQFDSLLTQIDQVAADAGFSGINLLTGGSSTVNLNETGTSSVTISGSQATSSGLGVAGAANSFQLDSNITAAMSNVTSALSSLQAISTTISSASTVLDTRIDFNKAMMDTLNTGADALTASDASADGAALLALQTRQQIASTSLSLSRAGDTSVLRLFGLDP
jgi:flagellin-like hook-associated protein FlgL